MCLPPISRGPPPAAKGKPPPSSSSSSSGSSSDGPGPLSPRKHRRRASNGASAEGDVPSGRVVSGNARQPSGMRYSAPLSRKESTRKSSRASSVAAGPAPSRRASSRDASRLAPPGSPPTGAERSPTFSTRSSRSPSKRQPPPQPQPQPPVSESTSRRKKSETPTQQAPTPRVAETARPGKREKKKSSSGKMDGMDGRERIISLRAPLQGGGVVTGLMVIRPGSSRRGSESGSSRSKGSSRKSDFGDRKRERPSIGMGKVIALTTGPVGLGISLENSRTPTPSSKAKVERIREIEPHQLQIPTIAIAAPTPDNSASKPAPQAPPQFQIHPPPPPAPVLAFSPPVPAPKPPVVVDVVVDVPKVVAPSVKYPIMATLVYPTKDQLAYQPIGHYRVTTSIIPSKVNPPAPPTVVPLAAPPPAPRAAPAPVKAAVRPPPAPPALQQYQDSSDSSPASSVHGHPLRGGGSPPISHRSSVASISTVSSSSSAASGSTISIVLEQEQPTPVAEHISYNPNATNSANSSTSSLATVSSAASGSTNRSSNYFRMEPPRAPTPETHVYEVDVPELSNRQLNYYRYAASQDTVPKPVRAIMDSPNPAAKRAGPWDGMPGADPNLGAYYRNAAAAKRRESSTEPGPVTSVKPKNNGVDEANLAAYYRQAEVQRRKFALERMKHEQLETDNETSASEVSSASEPWVDPNLAGYYRAAEATKKKKEQEAGAKRAILRWNADKALVASPAKEPTTMIAGRNVFFSSIRRTIPGMFHSASHAPHVPFAPPPAPTPPPGEGAGSALGEEDGPPDGAADSWFKNAKMGPDDSRPKASDYWTNSSETLPGVGAGEGEFPPTAPPPAPTPPLAREDSVPPSPGYYARSPRAGYGYHG